MRIIEPALPNERKPHVREDPDRIDKNALSYWFPKIEAAGLPVPRTVILDIPAAAVDDLLSLFDREEPKAALDAFAQEIARAAESFGYPFFLRNDYTSGKHQWNDTCLIRSADEIAQHMFSICYFSECVDVMGARWPSWDCCWIARELLPTMPVGRCPGHGDMPICKEFRFFVENGTVLCHHQYWPIHSLRQGDAIGMPWMSRVVQGSVFVKEFISSRQGFIADGANLCGFDASPSRFVDDFIFGKKIPARNDLFVHLNQYFSLSSLDPEIRQQNTTCLGGFRCRNTPIVEWLSSGAGWWSLSRLRTAENFIKQINSAPLDLFNLNFPAEVRLPVGTVGGSLLQVDRETAVSIENASTIGDDCWVIFHELDDIYRSGYKQVIITVWPQIDYDALCRMDNEAELSSLAAAAGRAVGGAWSVDLLETSRGWFVTDMAEAGSSWHWDGCTAR